MVLTAGRSVVITAGGALERFLSEVAGTGVAKVVGVIEDDFRDAPGNGDGHGKLNANNDYWERMPAEPLSLSEFLKAVALLTLLVPLMCFPVYAGMSLLRAQEISELRSSLGVALELVAVALILYVLGVLFGLLSGRRSRHKPHVAGSSLVPAAGSGVVGGGHVSQHRLWSMVRLGTAGLYAIEGTGIAFIGLKVWPVWTSVTWEAASWFSPTSCGLERGSRQSSLHSRYRPVKRTVTNRRGRHLGRAVDSTRRHPHARPRFGQVRDPALDRTRVPGCAMFYLLSSSMPGSWRRLASSLPSLVDRRGPCWEESWVRR